MHAITNRSISTASLPSWNKIEKRLNRYILEGKLGEYYEVAFSEMVAERTLFFDAVFFDANRWYEIDTMADLREAENLFTRSRSTRRSLMGIEPAANLA